MVLYRKYRSQTLDELVGQLSVKQTLKAAVASGKLAHAYLFCGPRGVGKTSTARILAKIVNCEKLDLVNVTPCNLCDNCLSITSGSNMDVIEMDAASNRGIEDIRTLRDNIKLAPSAAKKKVYIIDEVHMLTGEAFNALLKTLEEPPSHVIFILATTDAQKIPQTILSRVQKLEFKSATTHELVESLLKVATGEGIKIDQESLHIIAKKSQGSFRDAVKLLDQVSVLENISPAIIESNLGGGSFEKTVKLLELVATKNSGEALNVLNSELSSGVNAKEFNISLLEILRQVVYIKNKLGDQLVKVELEEDKYQQLLTLANQFSMPDLIGVIDCLTTSLEQGRYSVISSLPLEVAVIKGCLVNTQIVQSVVVNSVPAKAVGMVKQPVEEEVVPVDVAPDPKQIEADKIQLEDKQKIAEKWGYLLETVRQYNFSLEALLRSVKIGECDEKTVVLEVPYSFHQRIIEAPKSRDLLESILSDILGRSVRVAVLLTQKKVQRDELSNVELAADDEIVRLASEIFSTDQVN